MDGNNGYKIQNIVFAGKFESTNLIDPPRLSDAMQDATMRSNFPALICKNGTVNGNTMLLYKNGNFVVTGVKSREGGIAFINKMVEKLKDAGVDVINIEYKVVNIVGTGKLDSHIDLDRFIATMENSQYEPEVFPGLIYRMDNPKSVFLIFKAGKFVIAGSRSEEEAVTAVIAMKKAIQSNNLYLKNPVFI